ncbi:hypothetical protein NQ176_g1026 [Zarea fungicola]|uniref:Uncharacterized protein n=1 Tax=Zarea fungicola TaxID=93591 RepID=A0ACC1NUI5_9HYPO|nr:hypothetical protein NQ176_g1026 [Lecanicillium fungicola]
MAPQTLAASSLNPTAPEPIAANGSLSNAHLVRLAPMPQRRHVIKASDDWTGVTSTATRRKLQNRLNQRAYRQRRNGHKTTETIAGPDPEGAPEAANRLITSGSGHQALVLLSMPQGYKMLQSAQSQQMMLEFARRAYENFTICSPRPSQLQLLIRLNVLNAFTRNAELLGLPPGYLCDDDGISPFLVNGPNRDIQPLKLPTHLQPSHVQCSILHSGWLDLIPFPSMRDWIIMAITTGDLDEDTFCEDLLEVDDQRRPEEPYLLVWGDSCNPKGWEATPSFLVKYGWLVCPEIIISTNYWRETRGERPLVFP